MQCGQGDAYEWRGRAAAGACEAVYVSDGKLEALQGTEVTCGVTSVLCAEAAGVSGSAARGDAIYEHEVGEGMSENEFQRLISFAASFFYARRDFEKKRG